MTAVTVSTKIRESNVVIGCNELTCGMNIKMSRNRKNALASRRNCSKRFFGRNVTMLYLVVEIPLR